MKDNKGNLESRRRSKKDTKILHKVAVDLLIRFHIVFKLAKIFALNNDSFQEQARRLFDSLEAFFKGAEEATFHIRQSSLFFNGVRLKFGVGTYPIFKFILEEFKKRNLSALTFHPGLTYDELIQFAAVFARKEKKARVTFEEILQDLADVNISHISIEKIPPTETLASLEKNTAKMFFLSILHLKDSFEKDQKNEQIRINTTRRLMQSLFNHIVANEAFVYGLTNIKNHDEYTLNHSVNVCMLSIALGRRLGLSRGELIDLGIASFFHDLGKLDTPPEILNKPSQLDSKEREIIEQHPFHGAEKLVHLKEFKRMPLRAIHVALEHHIREDFSGYPKYFKKDDTNLFSKIVKVVDYFDAITTKRVYRKKVFTRAEALSLMLESTGTEFNPTILKAFANLMGIFPVGSLVALDSGEIGVVFDTNPDSKFMLRPKVKLISDPEGNKIDGDVVDLVEKNAETNKFRRTIVKALDPDKYDIQVSDYFLARAQ